MKKQLLILLVSIMAMATSVAQNYDFSAVTTDGQTLYYKINGNTVMVTHPSGFSGPSGDLVIPSSVSYNGITYAVTSIDDSAFCGCDLTSVTIPYSVTFIGSHTSNNILDLTGSHSFSGLRLTSIIVENGNPVYDSRNNCNAIIETATNTLIVGCINTTIPNTVTKIGHDAFHAGYLNGITTVNIPNSVTIIDDDAFSGAGLTSISIPTSVTSIGTRAFANNWDVTEVTIPNSVTNIGYMPFSGSRCALGSITVENGNPRYDSRDNCNAIIETATNKLIAGCKNTTIPNTVTKIGIAAFWGCTFSQITIPNSITDIEKMAFQMSRLESLTIGESVTTIGNRAFDDCSYLNEVISLAVVPPSLSECDYIFVNSGQPTIGSIRIPCGSLASYLSADGWKWYPSKLQEDCTTSTEEIDIRTCTGQTLRFEVNNQTHTATVVGYVGQCEGGLTVPAWFSIDDVRYTVTAIGPQAFQNCTGLTEVILPVTITLVDEEAFKGCSGLLKVDMK